MEPRVASIDEVNITSDELDQRLSQLDEEVSELRAAVCAALLDLLEQHVPQNAVDLVNELEPSGSRGHGPYQASRSTVSNICWLTRSVFRSRLLTKSLITPQDMTA